MKQSEYEGLTGEWQQDIDDKGINDNDFFGD